MLKKKKERKQCALGKICRKENSYITHGVIKWYDHFGEKIINFLKKK